MARKIIIIGALLSMLGVIIGAFGAHGLKVILEANQTQATFETAVKYHFYHALGILMIGILSIHFPHKLLNWAMWAMLIGTIFFSGSLYILSLTGVKVLGAITPIGGIGFILGWGFVVLAASKMKS